MIRDSKLPSWLEYNEIERMFFFQMKLKYKSSPIFKILNAYLKYTKIAFHIFIKIKLNQLNRFLKKKLALKKCKINQRFFVQVKSIEHGLQIGTDKFEK